MNKDGGPAFPYPGCSDVSTFQFPPTVGMSLRDYFAAKALQGILMGVSVDGVAMEPEAPISAAPIARDAYRMADAMLKARES
jgi:hypothetical protein